MNNYKKKCLIAMQLCSIVLLGLFVAASVRAQTATAPATDDRSDATIEHMSSPELSFAPSGFQPGPPTHSTRTNIDRGLTREFDKAWQMSGAGTSGREGVVLIFRMKDGSYVGRTLGFSNEIRKFTFIWNPAALAIVHTHPNNCDPRPADQDKRVANKYGVPNFTITISGMYVYDPVTKKTTKLLNGLDWLHLSTFPDGFKRWFGA
jgi:hypothetical protein